MGKRFFDLENAKCTEKVQGVIFSAVFYYRMCALQAQCQLEQFFKTRNYSIVNNKLGFPTKNICLLLANGMDVAIHSSDKQCFSICNALTTDNVGGQQGAG